MGVSEKAIRLRERFILDKSFDSFDEKETLQFLLTYANIKRDPEEIAERLLEKFGSLRGVLEARPEQLQTVEGVGAMAVGLISMVVPLTRIYERSCMKQPQRIINTREAEHYCKSILQGERNERFYVIAMSAKCNILGVRKVSDGSLNEVNTYPRVIMEAALNYNAHSVLLCHNHPGGTCAPSAEDIASTKQIQRLLSGVEILVLDHIIVAHDNTYSMIQHGDIDYRR